MPMAGRGAAGTADSSTRWNENEVATLCIFEVELTGLSAQDYETLWHAIFPLHRGAGRNYNMVKLKETYNLRHYDNKGALFRQVSRPNTTNLTQHTQIERTMFARLRGDIQTAAQRLGLALQTTNNQVDSGAMCTCRHCQGLVQPRPPRQPKRNADGEIVKSKPRGRNAGSKPATSASSRTTAPAKKSKNRRSRAVDDDEETEEDNRVEGGEEDEEDEINGDAAEQEVNPVDDYQEEASKPEVFQSGADYHQGLHYEAGTDYYQHEANRQHGAANRRGASRSRANRRDARRDAAYNNEAHHDDTHHGEIQQDGASDPSENPSDAPIRLTQIHRATADEQLPMFHLGDLVLRNGGSIRMLHPQAEPIDHNDPIYQHGGPIMIMHSYTNPAQGYPYMICDCNDCEVCGITPPEDVNLAGRYGFVHSRQCLSDEESNLLLFAPEDTNSYAPCGPEQEFRVREVVLSHAGRPARHLLAICVEESCEECGWRERDGRPR